jgi:hypothetical protein
MPPAYAPCVAGGKERTPPPPGGRNGTGTFSSDTGSDRCTMCPAKYYIAIVTGTFSSGTGSDLCTMCPANMTNLADGSVGCPVPILPGTDLNTRYAVVVYFGVYLDGTTLSEVSRRAGVDGPSSEVLSNLVR